MYQLMKTVLCLVFILRGGVIRIQIIDIKTVHLLNWYVVRLNPFLQILNYGKNFSAQKVSLASYADVVRQFVQPKLSKEIVRRDHRAFVERFSI